MNILKRLDRRVASAFYGNFSELREVQEAAIEPITSGRNVVLTSGTGSGKTEAVMAPMVGKYWQDTIRDDSLFALYIAPTKALVNDLEKRLLPPLSKLHLRLGIRHGDRDDLTSGQSPHILITTPESLDVMLSRQDSHLKAIRAVVLDEVHLLYNTQRGLQLSILLSRLRQFIAHDFQWAALSATIGNLSYVSDFIMGGNAEADYLSFSTTRAIDAQIRHANTLNELLKLIQILTAGRETKLLVFTNSRHECEKLSGALQNDEVLSRYVVTHYSSLSSEVRIETEKKFESLKTAICIATSTLELGIDIGDIDAVLLWGVPHSVDSFLQRIGRSNRRSHKTNVVCLIPSNSENVQMDGLRFATLLDSAQKGRLPIQEPYDLFGAVAQQCLSVIYSNKGKFTRIADLHNFVAHKSAVPREMLETILAELAFKGFLQKHGYKNRYGADEGLYRLADIRLIYGNFPIGSDTIDIFQGAKRLGEIPKVNLLSIRSGSSFRFAGRSWRVTKTTDQIIHVESAGKSPVTDDIFFGMGGQESQPYLTDCLWKVIHADEFDGQIFAKDLKVSIASFIKNIRTQCGLHQIPYRNTTEGIIYYTFAGKIVNRAIGQIANQNKSTSSNISLTVQSPIDWTSLPTEPSDYESCFSALYQSSASQSFYQKQLPLELQAHEYIQTWLKDVAIKDILTRLAKSEPVEVVRWPNF